MTPLPRGAACAAAVLSALSLTAAGCASGRSAGGAPPSSRNPKIALLLPESKTTRYEAKDRPLFTARVRQLCAGCRIIYGNAEQDSAKQQQQAEAALANGARVLVLDPVDGQAATGIVRRANTAGVPVLDYERLIPGADVAWHVSYDNVTVGRLQAKALVDRMAAAGKPDGTIVMINGSPVDNNAVQFKRGAHGVFATSRLRIGAEYDTADWSPDKAQQEMQQAITRLGKDRIDGVYAANDGTAGGAIAALRQAGVSPLPPVTGQDAEIAAIQRILTGRQFMTIYKAIAPEATLSAEVAVALARGGSVPSAAVNRQVDNGAKKVPARIFTPIVVTRDNLKSTVFADGFVTYAQVCTGDYAPACRRAGITG